MHHLHNNNVVTFPAVAIFQFNPNTYTVDEDVASGTQAVSLQLIDISGTLTTVLGLCTVVVWALPPCTNGQLAGYDLRFYRTNPDSVTPVSNRSDEIFRIVKETDVPSNQRGSTYVQVSTTILVAEQEAR